MKVQLNQLDLFAGIAPETLKRLEKAGSISEVAKGTLLIRARESVASIFIQLEGKSAFYKSGKMEEKYFNSRKIS